MNLIEQDKESSLTAEWNNSQFQFRYFETKSKQEDGACVWGGTVQSMEILRIFWNYFRSFSLFFLINVSHQIFMYNYVHFFLRFSYFNYVYSTFVSPFSFYKFLPSLILDPNTVFFFNLLREFHLSLHNSCLILLIIFFYKPCFTSQKRDNVESNTIVSLTHKPHFIPESL